MAVDAPEDYHPGNDRRSPEFRRAALAALRRFNARRPLMPKCGAKRKRDGQPCQNLPLGNGRCKWHGGKTPSGADWHRPQWPDGKGAEASRKLQAKLKTLQRAARKRERRVAAMTPEEKAQYQKWHRDRPPGSPEARASMRAQRASNASARAVMEALSDTQVLAQDPEYLALTADIETLKTRLAALEKAREAPLQKTSPDHLPEAFG